MRIDYKLQCQNVGFVVTALSSEIRSAVCHWDMNLHHSSVTEQTQCKTHSSAFLKFQGFWLFSAQSVINKTEENYGKYSSGYLVFRLEYSDVRHEPDKLVLSLFDYSTTSRVNCSPLSPNLYLTLSTLLTR